MVAVVQVLDTRLSQINMTRQAVSLILAAVVEAAKTVKPLAMVVLALF
jgi:hypothetical protein